jgi:hypothetical protein
MRCDVCIMAATMVAIWMISSTANARTPEDSCTD